MKGRNVFGLGLVGLGLLIVGLALWESVTFRAPIDVWKAALGLIIALGGATALDPSGAHAWAGDTVTLMTALPTNAITALRGGRRETDPPVVVPPVSPVATDAPIVAATHDPEKY